jgi:hypothetical protein
MSTSIETAELLASLRDLASSIAFYMPGYELADHPEDESNNWNPSAYIVRCGMKYVRGQTQGYDLHFDRNGRQRRLRVSCLWPTGYYPQDSKVITVAPDRPPQTIAKDILRRLDPWYREQYLLMLLARAERDVEIDARTALYEKWLAIMGPAAWSNYCRHAGENEIEIHYAGVDVKIHGSDKATLHIGYDRPALVESVLKILAETRVFVPPCEGKDNETEGNCGDPCTEDGTLVLEDPWGRRRHWYCPRHHAIAVAEQEQWEQERLGRQALHETSHETEEETDAEEE